MQPVWVMASTYNLIATAKAKQAKKPFDVEDFGVALIKFANGATVELEASWATHIKDREEMCPRLFGTKGGIVQKNIDS